MISKILLLGINTEGKSYDKIINENILTFKKLGIEKEILTSLNQDMKNGAKIEKLQLVLPFESDVLKVDVPEDGGGSIVDYKGIKIREVGICKVLNIDRGNLLPSSYVPGLTNYLIGVAVDKGELATKIFTKTVAPWVPLGEAIGTAVTDAFFTDHTKPVFSGTDQHELTTSYYQTLKDGKWSVGAMTESDLLTGSYLFVGSINNSSSPIRRFYTQYASCATKNLINTNAIYESVYQYYLTGRIQIYERVNPDAMISKLQPPSYPRD